MVFGIALIPTVCEKIVYSVYFHDHRWEFSPGMYFRSLEQLPQPPLTNLLIINNTGERQAFSVASVSFFLAMPCSLWGLSSLARD